MARCNHLVFINNKDFKKKFISTYADGKQIETFGYANKFCPKCGKMIDRPTQAEKKNK